MHGQAELALRLVAAFMAGVLIGFEREWRHKSAGMYSHPSVVGGPSHSTTLG